MKRKLERNTPAEELAIQAGIDADPDAREWTAEDVAHAVPAAQAMPPDLYRDLVERRVRGPGKAPAKELISVRLDRDLLEALRASGPGWQARINETLRKAVLG